MSPELHALETWAWAPIILFFWCSRGRFILIKNLLNMWPEYTDKQTGVMARVMTKIPSLPPSGIWRQFVLKMSCCQTWGHFGAECRAKMCGVFPFFYCKVDVNKWMLSSSSGIILSIILFPLLIPLSDLSFSWWESSLLKWEFRC